MKKQKPKRPSGDATRNKIFKAALALFMDYGFAGASMGNIAKKAGVNQSLISHHFGNKKRLWQQIKTEVINQTNVFRVNPNPKSVEDFVREAVTQRLYIYKNSPELYRLVSWEKLEIQKNASQLSGAPDSPFNPLEWITPIKYLQSQKKLNPEFIPELIMLWMIYSVNALISDDLGIFRKDSQHYDLYLKMIMENLTKSLSVHS